MAARLIRGVGRLLFTAGAASLAWCAYVLADADWSQRSARLSIQALRETGNDVVSGARPPGVARGAPLADLSIPRINLSAVVLNGSDTLTLRRGPGHIDDTALPGEPGNVAIAGHRDSFFARLRYIEVGDDVFLDTPHDHMHYRVQSHRVVSPTDVSVLEDTAESTVTLVTCYPFSFVGQAPDRFVVRATRVIEPREPASRQRFGMTSSER
jgi:sortase A